MVNRTLSVGEKTDSDGSFFLWLFKITQSQRHRALVRLFKVTATLSHDFGASWVPLDSASRLSTFGPPITLFQTCFLMEDGGGRSEDRCESVQQLQEVGGASGRRREVQTKSRQPGSSRTNDAAAVAHSSLLTLSSVTRCFDASSSLHATAFTLSTLLLPLHSCLSTFLSSFSRALTIPQKRKKNQRS